MENFPAQVSLRNMDDLYWWRVVINGPRDYYDGITSFALSLKFPKDFSQNPPQVLFPNLWHPNIKPNGELKASFLHRKNTDAYRATPED